MFDKIKNVLFGNKKKASPPPPPAAVPKSEAGLEKQIHDLMNRHEVGQLELNQDFTKRQLELENEFQRKYVKINGDLAEMRGLPPMPDLPSLQPGADIAKMHPMFGSYMGPAALPAFPAASMTTTNPAH
jgi:hypothetical protein